MNIRVSGRKDSGLLRLDTGSKTEKCRRSSASTLEPLENMVTCPIDLNFMEDPRLLPCGHAFCCTCLNKYMEKLAHDLNYSTNSSPNNEPNGNNNLNNTKTFACPICRREFLLPADLKANCFPKSFNHTAILDFLRQSRNSELSEQSKRKESIQSNQTSSRKTSIQVSSQMLNYIVDDLTARHREDGHPTNEGTSTVNSGQIQDHVRSTRSSSVKIYSRPNPNLIDRTQKSNTPNTISPADSTKHLERFHGAASRILSMSKSNSMESKSNSLTYDMYRDAETVRVIMKRNALFTILDKGKDCCIMRPGEEDQPMDMQLSTTPNSSIMLRCTVSTSPSRDELILWRQQIPVPCERFNFNTRFAKQPKCCLKQSNGPIVIGGADKVRVQFLRFFKNHIYCTGIISPNQQQQQQQQSKQPIADQMTNGSNRISEFGILVCCAYNENLATDQSGTNSNSDLPVPTFPVVATSSFFYRDNIGIERPNQPIVYGFDIDQENGNVYVAQPANAMICRLKMQDLTRIDRTWYLNDPQLSPHFICYTKTNHSIWGTCPTEDKIIILNLSTDAYFHFTPSISFGIIPSHIVCTTDQRILVLDKSQSELYWITKIQNVIGIQRLKFKSGNRTKKTTIVALQAIQDLDLKHVHGNSKQFQLHGGLVYGHHYGCTIIYPKYRIAEDKLVQDLELEFR